MATASEVPIKAKFQSISYERQIRSFKIIVVGDTNVGKTCLTYRFCEGKFPARTEATIGVDFREKTVCIDGEMIKLQLWDTAGQERFRRSMIHHYYRNAHAIVFVYDVTKLSSFRNLNTWIDECSEHDLISDEIPRIIVGNKCENKDKVVITFTAAAQFADGHSMPVFETSAIADNEADHVNAIFMTLAHKLKNAKPLMLGPSPAKNSVNIRKPSVRKKQDEDKSWCC